MKQALKVTRTLAARRINMAGAQICFALLAVAGLATRAPSQPGPVLATSLEATVLSADSVAVATLVEYTLAPDATTIIDATFSIDETLKGHVPKTLKIPINRAFRTFHGWVEGSSRVLIVGRDGAYSVIRLSVPDLAILRSDFTLLRDGESVVRAARQICLASPGVTGVLTVRVSVPHEVAEAFPQTGMGMFLDCDDR